MCYNSKCKIEIKSCIDGSASKTSVNGTVVKTPSELRFEYALDGDECTFAVKDNEAVQERRGKQNIKMTFRKGEQTECFLGSDGFSGSFAVFTQDLLINSCDTSKKAVGTNVFIVYKLGEEKIELTFSAEYNFNAKV